MPDEFVIDREKGMVKVRSYGALTTGDMKETLARASKAQSEERIHNMLIDASRLESVPNIIGIFNTMANLPPGLRIALVVNEGQATYGGVRFGETVAVNRGKAVGIFDDADAAIAWLTSRREIPGRQGPLRENGRGGENAVA